MFGGRRASFAFIFATALLSAISFSLIVPVLPTLVRQLTGGDTADAAEWMAVMAIAWGVSQFLTAPILGALSDRFGRRPVMLISSAGLGLDFIFMALAPSLTWLLVARVISGATAANFSTANAYVADAVPEAERPRAFGLLASALSVGFMIGPALGGWLAEFHLRLPFVIAAALTLLNVLYGAFVLPESLPPELRSAAVSMPHRSRILSVRMLAENPALLRLSGISFLNTLANMIWGTVWVLFCAHRFGWSPGQMGLQIFASGALGIGVQAWLAGRVVRRFGEARTLIAGLMISAASLAYASVAPDTVWFVVSMPIAAFGLLIGPSLQSLISRETKPAERGKVQGAMQSLNAVAIIIGPLIYAGLFAWSLRHTAGLDFAGLPLMLAAAFLLCAVPLAAMSTARAPS